MKSYSIMFICLLLMFAACEGQLKEQNISIKLDSNWTFKAVKDSLWMKATVPGSVHTDLMANNIIEDPYYRLNELEVQWVDKLDWEYKCNFHVDSAILENDEVNLIFHGLDTYAEISLNGSELLVSNNMFIAQDIPCKELLIEGSNDLQIIFRSPINVGIDKREDLGYFLPGAENDQSERGEVGDIKTAVFSRKAQYHFGWDWGPRLVTSGIWKEINLEAWDNSKIKDMHVNEMKIGEMEAFLDIQLNIQNFVEGEHKVQILVDGKMAGEWIEDFYPGVIVKNYKIKIDEPRIWWPNGLGEQPLYEIQAVLLNNNTITDNYKEKIGLRTIEVVQEADSTGHSFAFKVNGHEIFMKGANYIPQDIFLARVSDEDYEKLIKDAVDANFNMLRIWGGGVYERDIFYDLCDQYGILVWQDFMFACAMYPGNDEFLHNVEVEATFQVKRLRDHPSIALWCGDNEILSAWNRWGWKENVIENQGLVVADRIWQAYDTLFHDILPSVVKLNDPAKFYWSSSPSAGIGQLEDWKSGDVHYWGVWWGKEPFENYETKIGRFMSEYGFQSFPDIHSVKKYTIEEDWDVFSEVMKSHQRSSIGNGTIIEYMDRDYKKPKGFEDFLYVNHVLQAEGIRTAIEAHRRNMPFCMGSLYWQLNDCWPVASWSGMDYYGDWKAMHYFVKKAFEPILVSPVINDKEQLDVFVVSDHLEDKKGELQLTLMDFNGEEKWSQKKEIEINGNTSASYFNIGIEKLIKQLNKEEILLNVELLDENGKLMAQNHIFFSKPAELELSSPEVAMTVELYDDVFAITLDSELLAKNVYLNPNSIEGHFSNNYFDILPGESMEITFTPKETITKDHFIENFKLHTLVDTYNDSLD